MVKPLARELLLQPLKEKTILKIDLAITVIVPRKTKPGRKISLNKNVERNLHPFVYNQAKIQYKEELAARLALLSFGGTIDYEIACIFTFYNGTKHRCDLGNVSVVEKFANDALVDLDILKDDSTKYVPALLYFWGGVDKENPRCELEIIKL